MTSLVRPNLLHKHNIYSKKSPMRATHTAIADTANYPQLPSVEPDLHGVAETMSTAMESPGSKVNYRTAKNGAAPIPFDCSISNTEPPSQTKKDRVETQPVLDKAYWNQNIFIKERQRLNRKWRSKRSEFVNEIIRPRPIELWKLNCFTDGSKTKIVAGASYYMMGHDENFYCFKRQESIHSGQFVTVFQSETTAIARATLEMIEENVTDRFINFYIESQSAIKAIASFKPRPTEFWELKFKLFY